MKDNIKFEFSNDEKSLITKSLNNWRNELVSENKSTESIDEILVNIQDNKVELDYIDAKILINSLNNYRYKLKDVGLSCSNVNDVLLKIINETDKKKLQLRIWKGNARR